MLVQLLQRTDQWAFKARANGKIIFECKDEDEFQDQLLNRFDRGYYRPLQQKGVPCAFPTQH